MLLNGIGYLDKMKDGKISENKIIDIAVVVVAALLSAFRVSNTPLSVGMTYADSSVFTYIARLIVNGGMPYRDSFDHKGPIIYLIDALGLLINKDIGIWIIELASFIIIYYFTIQIAKLFSIVSIKYHVCILLSAVLIYAYCIFGGNLTEEYACVFITIAFYVFLKYFKTEAVGRLELVICGACFSAVLFLKMNVVILWIVMCIGIFVKELIKRENNKLFFYSIWFLGGALAVALILCAWLFYNGAFSFFIKDYIEFNITYSSYSGESSQALTELFKCILDNLLTPESIIGLGALIYVLYLEYWYVDLMCLATMVLSLVIISLPRRMSVHYGMILCPISIYAIIRLVSEIEKRRKIATRNYVVSLVVVSALIMLILSKTAYYFVVDINNKVHGESIPSESAQIAEVIKANTGRGDTISVCGTRDILYLLSERDSSSIYSFQYPIADMSSKIKNEYLDDMAKFDAKIVILNGKFLRDEMVLLISNDYQCIDKIGNADIYLRKW